MCFQKLIKGNLSNLDLRLSTLWNSLSTALFLTLRGAEALVYQSVILGITVEPPGMLCGVILRSFLEHKFTFMVFSLLLNALSYPTPVSPPSFPSSPFPTTLPLPCPLLWFLSEERWPPRNVNQTEQVTISLAHALLLRWHKATQWEERGLKSRQRSRAMYRVIIEHNPLYSRFIAVLPACTVSTASQLLSHPDILSPTTSFG